MPFDRIIESETEVCFRLFPTTNMWNFLLLDSSNGKVWQVQFTVDNDNDWARITVPINRKSLLNPEELPRNGRFTLQATQNMYNFILLDQEVGRIYQCQWTLDNGFSGIMPILPFPTN